MLIATANKARKKAAPRRTQAQRRDASEQRLLAAAAKLIAQHGFGAATFERVGDLAGYSRGLASQKFGSKDGLVRAVIGFLVARMEGLYDKQLRVVDSPKQKVIAYVDVFLSNIAADQLFRAYFIMMAAAIANRLPVASAFLDWHEAVKVRLRELIKDGQRSREISGALDAEAVALSIGSLLLGIAMELLLDPRMDMPALRRAALSSVARTLGARDDDIIL